MKEQLWAVNVLETLQKRPDKECDIVSLHDRVLYFAAFPDRLLIKDHMDEYYQFAACLDHMGTLRIGAYTRKPIGNKLYKRHPDMFGVPLFRFTLRHFESANMTVERIHDIWLGDIDQFGNYETNYDQWNQFQKNAVGLSDEERNWQAVTQTLSAKVYADNGFVPDMSTYHYLPKYLEDPPQVSLFFVRNSNGC